MMVSQVFVMRGMLVYARRIMHKVSTDILLLGTPLTFFMHIHLKRAEKRDSVFLHGILHPSLHLSVRKEGTVAESLPMSASQSCL
jgi:hypothetical protein